MQSSVANTQQRKGIARQGKSSQRKLHTKDMMRCMLCPDESVFKEMKVKSWRSHCRTSHKDFIAERMEKVKE